MLYIIYAVENYRRNVDLQGLKEVLALDAERYGDIKSIVIQEDRPQQISMAGPTVPILNTLTPLNR